MNNRILIPPSNETDGSCCTLHRLNQQHTELPLEVSRATINRLLLRIQQQAEYIRVLKALKGFDD